LKILFEPCEKNIEKYLSSLEKADEISLVKLERSQEVFCCCFCETTSACQFLVFWKNSDGT